VKNNERKQGAGSRVGGKKALEFRSDGGEGDSGGIA